MNFMIFEVAGTWRTMGTAVERIGGDRFVNGLRGGEG